MREISSVEAQRNFSVYREIAEGAEADPETVVVLHHSKPSVVIVSAAEYARLKRRDKQAVLTEDLPEWMAERIATAEMDSKFAALDKET